MARNGAVNFRIGDALRFLDGSYLCPSLVAVPSDFVGPAGLCFCSPAAPQHLPHVLRALEGIPHGFVLVMGNLGLVLSVMDSHARTTSREKL